MNNYFKLYANCIPVKGAKRSVICDLQRNKVKFIPNDLYDILSKHSQKCIEEIFEIYNTENKQTIIEYFNFLIKNELGCYLDYLELEKFPPLDLSYESPYEITNAIIDHSEINMSNYRKIFNQLDELGSVDLQLRFFDKLNINVLDKILSYTYNSRIKSIQIIAKYDEKVQFSEGINLLIKHLRIVSIIIHSAPYNKNKNHFYNVPIIYTKEEIKDESHCGIISSKFFELNLTSFTEAINFNSCLNNKISIDKGGNIKNCPSMKLSYGNVNDIELKNVLKELKFKSLNKITKDQIQICKDCEFRYICTDCRAYLEQPDQIYSKPLKCGYDPYTNKWSNWTTNPLKKDAISFYKMNLTIK